MSVFMGPCIGHYTSWGLSKTCKISQKRRLTKEIHRNVLRGLIHVHTEHKPLGHLYLGATCTTMSSVVQCLSQVKARFDILWQSLCTAAADVALSISQLECSIVGIRIYSTPEPLTMGQWPRLFFLYNVYTLILQCKHDMESWRTPKRGHGYFRLGPACHA